MANAVANRLRIRDYASEDFDEIYELEKENFPVDYLDAENLMILIGQTNALVVQYDGKICGYMISELIEGDFRLHRIAIQPKFQRLGIGGKLLERLTNKVKRAKALSPRLLTWVGDSNLGAHLFFKKNGFQAVKGEDGKFVQRGYFRELEEDAYIFEWQP
jgi:ribosomal-protein-alanine N-acetyltransferase